MFKNRRIGFLRKWVTVFLSFSIAFSGLLLPAGKAAAQVPEWMDRNGLIAYWNFDEVTGTAVTDSVYGLTSNLRGSISNGGKNGKALQFNASNFQDYLGVQVPADKVDVFNNLDAVTIGMWVKPGANSPDNGLSYLITSNYATTYKLEDSKKALRWELDWTDNTMRAGIQGNTGGTETGSNAGFTKSDPAVSMGAILGEWHYLTMTYDTASRTTSYYLDGELISQAVTATALPVNLSVFRLGGHNWDFNSAQNRPLKTFRGLMDEVAIYNRALSPVEVSHLHLGLPLPSDHPPVADNPTIAGTPQPGKTLTGSYTYSDANGDPEGASLYTWYRGAMADGSDKAPLDGAHSRTYTVRAEDVSRYLFFQVTPIAQSGTAVQGQPALSQPVQVAPAAVETDGALTPEQLKGYVSKGSFSPVTYVPDMSFTGDYSQWETLPGIRLPATDEQVKLNGWAGEADLSYDAHYGYNESNFYLGVQVRDNVFYPQPGGSNWSADGLQFAFADGNFRSEHGIALAGDGTADIQRYEGGNATAPVSSIRSTITRKGDYTVYELAIPWAAVISKAPDPGQEIGFTLLANDSDGAKRRGYIEWTGGIGGSKDISLMARLRFIPPQPGWTSWFTGTEHLNAGETGNYSVFIQNFSSEAKTYSLTIPDAGITAKSFVIPANQAYRQSFSLSLPESRELTAVITEPASGLENRLSKEVAVIKAGTHLEQMLAEVRDQMIPGLRARLNQARSAGIATDYETVNLAVMEKTLPFGFEDIEMGYLVRAEYIANSLHQLYDEAMTKLNAYLGGTAQPLGPVPRYQTGKIAVDGRSLLGKTTEGENQPIIFTGYGMFRQVRDDVPLFSDLGANIIDFNIYPMELFKKPGLAGWKTWSQHEPSIYRLDKSSPYNGNGSMKITAVDTANPPAGNNSLLYQAPLLKSNTSYIFTFAYKTENAPGARLYSQNWSVSQPLPDSEGVWSTYSFEMKTKEVAAPFQTGITIRKGGSSIWVDDFKLVEKGTDENLFINGDFEQEDGQGDYIIDESYIDNTILPVLRNAEEHNIAVNIELALQGFPDWVYQEYPDTRNPDNYGFLKMDIENPRVQELFKLHIKTVLNKVKDSPAVQAINLSNESEYVTNNGVYNQQLWRQHLAQLHGTVAAMNALYGTSYSSFNEAGVPDMTTVTPSALYFDYLAYKTERFTAFHQMLADEVHQYAPDMPVHVKLMGFGVTFNDLMLKGGKDPEQIAALSNLTGIDGGPEYGGGVNVFAQHVGMLDMLSSMKEQPVFNSENHMISDGEERYNENVARWTGNWIWTGALHGTSATAIWVWQRDYTTGYLQGSILNRPDAIAQVGHTALDLNRLVHEVTAFQNAPAEVAVLYSNTNRLYSPDYNLTLNRAYYALSYNGQKVGFITENQITDAADSKLDAYKLLVLPEITNLSGEALQKIREWQENGGLIVLIGSEDQLLKADGRNLPLSAVDRSAILNHTGTTKFASDPSVQAMRTPLFGLLHQLGLDDVIVYDAATNEPVREMEWRTVEHEGRTLLSLVNYSEKIKNVYVKVQGQTVTPIKELIGGSLPASSALRAEPYGHYLYVLSQQGPQEPQEPQEPAAFVISDPQFVNAAGSPVSRLNPREDLHGRVSVTNQGDTGQDAALIAALYAPDGHMVNYSYVETSAVPRTPLALSAGFKLPIDVAGYTVKMFVWDSLEGMKPLSGAVSLP